MKIINYNTKNKSTGRRILILTEREASLIISCMHDIWFDCSLLKRDTHAMSDILKMSHNLRKNGIEEIYSSEWINKINKAKDRGK